MVLPTVFVGVVLQSLKMYPGFAREGFSDANGVNVVVTFSVWKEPV
jgi:hypothetical protein